MTGKHLVRRRTVLAGMAVTTAAAVPAVVQAAGHDDPCVELWRRWRPLEDEWYRLRDRRQAIWETLPRHVQYPFVQLGRKPVYTDEEIDNLTNLGLWNMPEWHHKRDAARARLKSDLREATRYAEAEHARIGVTELDEQMDVLSAAIGPLLTALVETPATSSAGIAAKIDAAIEYADPTGHLDDYPYRILVFMVRQAMPELPADMAERLEMLAAGDCRLRDLERLATA